MGSEDRIWEAAFVLSVSLLIIGLASAFFIHRQPRRHGIVRPFSVILVTVFLSLVALFYPAFQWLVGADNGGFIETLLLSIQASFEVFMVQSFSDLFIEPLRTVDSWVKSPFMIYASLLCLCAPILLLSFVLSFVKSVSAYCAYASNYYREVYIFSKLNDRSLVLAKSVLEQYGKNGRRKPRIIFTAVSFDDDSSLFGLYESARDLKCICFRKDILSVRFDIHSKDARMNFVIIGDDQHENNTQALRLLEKPAQGEKPDYTRRLRENTWLYVIDSSQGTKLLLDGKMGAMTIRRIDHTRQFIHYLLWEGFWDERTGEHALFSSAIIQDGIQRISVLLVGMGKNGSEMLKALAWFGQMDGYHLEIHALDIDPAAAEKLSFQCPELLDGKYNHKNDLNEAMHSITIHSGIDVNSQGFLDVVKELAARTTLAFVSLGDGEQNVAAATNLRVLFERYGDPVHNRPPIYAVLHDSEKIAMLSSVSDFSKDNYYVNLVGGYEDLFSYQMIFDPRLENEAEEYHVFWSVKSSGDATDEQIRETSEEFWSKEYYRNSSISRVIHNKAVRKYGPLSDESRASRSEAETSLIAGMLEHRRWNTYMRSEGFVYSGTRNNLAKQHNLLVRYDELPTTEQEKDYKGDNPEDSA